MIPIGGAIGSGLFLGAGGRLHSAGPALMLVYALAGAFAFLVVRAMGEMVMHRPTSGFVSYSREFIGQKATPRSWSSRACATSSGLVVLAAMATGSRRALGWVLLAAAVTPVGDMLIVLTSGGLPATAFGVHGATAAVVAPAGILVLRGASARRA